MMNGTGWQALNFEPDFSAPSAPAPGLLASMLADARLGRRGIFGNAKPPAVNPQANAASPEPVNAAPVASSQPPQGNPMLGGSMRQPFDYAAAANSIIPAKRGINWLGVLTDTLAGAAGREGPYAAMLRDEEKQRRDGAMKLAGWQYADWSRQNEADLKAADPFTIGRNRLSYNPATGQTETLYHGSADWEDYAASQNLQPGTPEYFTAVEDYVLRGAGPTARENYQALDDRRTDNDIRLEGVRSGFRTGLERLRQSGRERLRGLPSYRDTHPTARGGGASAKPPAVPTATNPDTGEKLQYVNGKWTPIK